MSLDWLRVCANEQDTDCFNEVQILYLAAVLVGFVLLAVVARRSRDLSTATLTLMPVAIAINIAVGAIVVALRLPIYLDSIGTVLVGVLAGPWAGALTGLLSNLIWSILPVPGGAGPTIAFFAPVAGVIGLMAGFWARGGIFRLRPNDPGIGNFLAVAAAIAAAIGAFLVVQQVVGLPDLGVEDQAKLESNQLTFVLYSIGFLVVGIAVGWLARRTVFDFERAGTGPGPYLVGGTGIAAGALIFGIVRLLFAPDGWLSSINGSDPDDDGPLGPLFGGADLSGLSLGDPGGLYVALAIAVAAGVLVAVWANRSDNARLFPVWIGGLTTGLVAAMISAPIAGGVFGGVTGAGTDLVVAVFRTLGLGVFQSAFAQGLTSDPLDKTISYSVVFAILTALPVTYRTMFSRGEDTVAE